MEFELHLPWDNDALQLLLQKIIQTGETTKVDFKRQLNISSSEHHAELLKDISAVANTYDYPYRNHGFIILGVSENQLSFINFEQNLDALQAKIDELIKIYIEPFIPTQLRIFGSGDTTWGALIIPPTKTAPHIFVKDIHKRYRGDIYVRRGTTTDKAGPSDYVRFFRLHLDEHTYELREQIEYLKREVTTLKSVPPSKAARPQVTKLHTSDSKPRNDPSEGFENTIEPSTPLDLPNLINTAFARAEDPIASALLREVQKIQIFLSSDSIPWGLNNINKEIGRKYLDDIENCSKIFWASLASIIYKDETGKYDETILKCFSYLAQVYSPPIGTSYTDWGANIRYLSLVVSLYILFTVGVPKRRTSLLKKILTVPIVSRSPYEEPIALPNSLFRIRRAGKVFQTQHPGFPNQWWCDAVGSVIEQILQRAVIIDDPIWERRSGFFIGEFVLCLTPLDAIDSEANAPSKRHPSNGAYLYYMEAVPFIKRFLRKDASVLTEIFIRPVRDILSDFDSVASRLIPSGCFPDGFAGGAVKEAFPDCANMPSE